MQYGMILLYLLLTPTMCGTDVSHEPSMKGPTYHVPSLEPTDDIETTCNKRL